VVDVNVQNGHGATLLHYAVKHKQGEIVIRAIESGATVCVVFSVVVVVFVAVVVIFVVVVVVVVVVVLVVSIVLVACCRS
jgi:hypothetical protein